MSKMARAFNTTVLELEDELMQLILDGQINARIDSHSKVNTNVCSSVITLPWSMYQSTYCQPKNATTPKMVNSYPR